MLAHFDPDDNTYSGDDVDEYLAEELHLRAMGEPTLFDEPNPDDDWYAEEGYDEYECW